ncbi:RNA polymerase sigma factor WhiG [Modestobacter sp. I12A-02628]|uniref:RNA polymerase sigma factor n=1 Tax=Goekera deserti TaxID=2497753 RepID=A0A7K3WH25_9ACTN|nr:RNA polymerase sigma factor WhiG [Goekera deserti]MPQ97256.1 RNA polymerase sigma factor WhiG [Goekera deserti]NDI50233.1 RNA polymerase sigma factor WhiG [Goekera deserti]NEL55801.1 RNA polymerase sigma factor WhiG [Goekera deserti]
MADATVTRIGAAGDADAAIADLWARYVADRGTALRDRLILHYAPLVKYVAGRVGSGLPAHVEQADLISYGTFGLIDAITRYEPSREVKFESYAMTRIRGAIIDELRSTDWIPRSVRVRAREFERTVASLEAKLQRSPTDSEVAAEMGMEVEEIRKFLGQLSLVNVVALDELLNDEDGSAPRLVDTLKDSAALDPQAMVEHGEARQLLARAVEQLPEREKVVVSLYYFEGLTLAEIGRVLGVTESRICQLHTKAVLHLRTKLADIA